MGNELHAVVDVDVLQEFLSQPAAVDTEMAVEAVLRFDSGGVHASAIDSSKVIIIETDLAADAFEAFDTDGLSIGVNTSLFDDYLDHASAGELVELEYDAETRRMHIHFSEASFAMRLIDPDAVEQVNDTPRDNVRDQMTTDYRIATGALDHATDVADMVSDVVHFESREDDETPVRIFGEGDVDEASVEPRDSLDGEPAVETPSETMVAASYLQNLTGAMPDDGAVRIRHGEELPMLFDYEIADDAGDVAATLAPRIGNH